jgi:hypothetical protein
MVNPIAERKHDPALSRPASARKVECDMTAESAAALLGTSPLILDLWQERFGYPVPECSGDGQRLYPDGMMHALRDALSRELSIASAITEARRVQRQDDRTGTRDGVGRSHEDPEAAR